MSSEEDELFEDEPFEDEQDDRFTWQIDAENAVDRTLEEADFDDVRGAITIEDVNLGCLKVRSRAQFSCPGFGPR